MKFHQWILVILGFLAPAALFAGLGDLPDLKVAPWNGHLAALSMTFDDGDPSHLDVAVPELEKRKMKATFFLIANQIVRKDEWRKLPSLGHEIGNHSLDHKHVNEFKEGDEKSQVLGARNVLQKEFGVPLLTFAYPFTETSPTLTEWVGKTHLLGRGGYGNYVMKPDLEPDWLNIPARVTMTDLDLPAYQQWIDEDLAQGAWTVLMIHGLEGTTSGWQPITRKNFTGILDYLQSKDIWVETFLRVGAYFRAQKIFEKAVPTDSGVKRTWSWKVPDIFPGDVVLKVRAQTPAGGSGSFVFSQPKGVITPDKDGFCAVTFSQGAFTVEVLPKR